MKEGGSGRCRAARPPFRRELEANVPAELNTVLAFYRSELASAAGRNRRKRARQAGPGAAGIRLRRRTRHAKTRPQQWRDLDQSRGEISGRGRQGERHAEARSGQAGVRQYGRQRSRPHASTSRPSRSPAAPADRNRRTVRCSTCRREIPYSLKVAGRPARSATVEVTAGDAWGVMIAPQRGSFVAADLLMGLSAAARLGEAVGDRWGACIADAREVWRGGAGA